MSADLLCYLSSPDSHFIICQHCEDVTLATHQRPKLQNKGLTLKNVGLKVFEFGPKCNMKPLCGTRKKATLVRLSTCL